MNDTAFKESICFLPADSLKVVNDAMRDGAVKYGVGEWKQNDTSWIKHFKAAKRHMKHWVGGESIHADSKINALGHAIARLLIVLEHELHDLGLDDRDTYVDRSHD